VFLETLACLPKNISGSGSNLRVGILFEGFLHQIKKSRIPLERTKQRDCFTSMLPGWSRRLDKWLLPRLERTLDFQTGDLGGLRRSGLQGTLDRFRFLTIQQNRKKGFGC
jgi:hypothetical protein